MAALLAALLLSSPLRASVSQRLSYYTYAAASKLRTCRRPIQTRHPLFNLQESGRQEQLRPPWSELAQGTLHLRHAPGDVLSGGQYNYTIVGPLGSGTSGFTYEAEFDHDGDSKKVAIKTLSLSRMSSWKQLDLFKRESSLLRSINHPSVPRYLDYFETQTSTDLSWHLVQELASGRSLGDFLRSNQRFQLDEIRTIAKRLLEVLDHLGTLSPPIIHRDFKPDNIVYDPRRRDEPSGGLYVVDFGGVQSVDVDGDMSGTTMMVGTYGYMPPEQFQGRATTKSDLYGLGATLLCLITGKSPSSFPQYRLKVDISSEDIPSDLKTLLNGLLEPVEEDRLTAKQALRILEEGGAESNDYSIDNRKIPDNVGRLAWYRDGDTFVLKIRPEGIRKETVSLSTFMIAWNSFIFIWTRLALTAVPFFATFSLPFWTAGFQMGRQSFQELYRGLVATELTISRRNFKLIKEIQPPSFISKLKSNGIISKFRSKISGKLNKRSEPIRKLLKKEITGKISKLSVGEIKEVVSADADARGNNQNVFALEIFISDSASVSPTVLSIGEGLNMEELSELQKLIKTAMHH